jgi:hypothetical protein
MLYKDDVLAPRAPSCGTFIHAVEGGGEIA